MLLTIVLTHLIKIILVYIILLMEMVKKYYLCILNFINIKNNI